MSQLALQDLHHDLGAVFTEVGDSPVVARYGNLLAEYEALTQTAAFLDFSFRGRLCLTGADRVRFLHGQVTNDVKALSPGTGCYAAIVDAKGRMESDAYIYCLTDELLLDFEPGLTRQLTERLEKYIVADDVQVVDVSSLYGLLTVQGPRAEAAVRRARLLEDVPSGPLRFSKKIDADLGEIYLVNQPRLGTQGFDLFVPAGALRFFADVLLASVRAEGGGPAGWDAFETARIEAGIPRFAADMDNTNFPQECGLEARAMSYSKGCYIGQEVLNRIHTVGHVNRILRGFRLAAGASPTPAPRDRLCKDGREVGYLTSVAQSPKAPQIVALGYVRKGADAAGTELILRTQSGDVGTRVMLSPSYP
ncbi:MAG TPA: glycine cleavage T C-terminal barrel domain-containing protein [Verrucomicrobiae bacterium]